MNDSQSNQKEKELLSAIVNVAQDAMIAADQEGRIIYWNPAAETIFGYSAKEVINQSLTMLMPERFRAGHTAGMRRYLATGEVRVIGKTVELAGLRKNGTEFPLELSLAVCKQNDAMLFVSIIRDISVRKRTEEKLATEKENLALTNQYMVDRELRMVELKREIDGLLTELHKPKKYNV